ncbi:Hsp20/alpha crystallin family protein [Streptomyces sp. TRM76323]|uniref:Hsp20/alpha crystallin family protein n=1 Tax=Streptomyces tamarix TaxID=3078565 RepID=A0ABU3QRJ0_9ACTN|nr:Hsp20/alpha crystallin family protein [Streptomyces tamarix]MDT9685356.1 Hsp20/alpha crystallin family protein [Streptomyces tamarix]
MLMRTDPFRELDRLTRDLFDDVRRPADVPMDAWRTDDAVRVAFDLPGVDPDSIDLRVERGVLTVTAERGSPVEEGAEVLFAERPTGAFSRRLFLGDTLDADGVEATYDAGVLRLRIPVAERAKPRRIQIGGAGRKALGP